MIYLINTKLDRCDRLLYLLLCVLLTNMETPQGQIQRDQKAEITTGICSWHPFIVSPPQQSRGLAAACRQAVGHRTVVIQPKAACVAHDVETVDHLRVLCNFRLG